MVKNVHHEYVGDVISCPANQNAKRSSLRFDWSRDTKQGKKQQMFTFEKLEAFGIFEN